MNSSKGQGNSYPAATGSTPEGSGRTAVNRTPGCDTGKTAASFVLGLTGGIGTGKSTAAAYLTSRGFTHIDADQIGRDLTRPGSPVLAVLEETFGKSRAHPDRTSLLLKDGSLDRAGLAGIVFADPHQKARLDGIMFAEILCIIRERIGAAEGPVLLDAPLLFESGADTLCDAVLLVTADGEARIRRVMARDGASREDVLARIRSQMSDAEKRQKADLVVDNSGSREELFCRLDEALQTLLCGIADHGFLSR